MRRVIDNALFFPDGRNVIADRSLLLLPPVMQALLPGLGARQILGPAAGCACRNSSPVFQKSAVGNVISYHGMTACWWTASDYGPFLPVSRSRGMRK